MMGEDDVVRHTTAAVTSGPAAFSNNAGPATAPEIVPSFSRPKRACGMVLRTMASSMIDLHTLQASKRLQQPLDPCLSHGRIAAAASVVTIAGAASLRSL